MKSSGLSKFAFFGTVLMAVAVLLLSVILVFSFKGLDSDCPVLIMYGTEGEVPKAALRKALSLSGMDYIVLSERKWYDSDGNIDVSKVLDDRSNKDRDILISAQGETAVDVLNAYAEVDEVKGFILIEPEIGGNLSIEGFSDSFPDKDVFILTSKTTETSDARLLYERLSGEDSLYGVYAESDMPFGSDKYFDPSGNRAFYISGFSNTGDVGIYCLPTFQIELSEYINAVYDFPGNKNPTGFIMSWYILSMVALFAFLAGLFALISSLPTVKKPSGVRFTVKDKVTLFTCAFFSLCLSALAGVFAYKQNDSILSIILSASVFVPALITAISDSGDVIRNMKQKQLKPKNRRTAQVLSILSGLFVLLFVLYVCGTDKIDGTLIKLLIVIMIIALDFVLIMAESLADLYSRIDSGMSLGYFGRYAYVLTGLLPSLVTLLVTFIISDGIGIENALLGISASLVPMFLALPVHRHLGDSFYTAMAHAAVSAVLVFALL